MERMFSMMCSMICWPRMVHWFVRFIGQSLGGTTNFSWLDDLLARERTSRRSREEDR